MINPEFLENPAFRRYMLQVEAGQILFKEGDAGNTLFVIVHGSIRLFQVYKTEKRTISVLGGGEILGERALVSQKPYPRAFSALVETASTLLEFDRASLQTIAKKLPEFSVKLLDVVVQRLDHTNQLLAINRIPNPFERMGRYILFLCNTYGNKQSQGTEFTLNPKEQSWVINVEATAMDQWVRELVKKQILKASKNAYLLTDESALFQFVEETRVKAAA